MQKITFIFIAAITLLTACNRGADNFLYKKDMIPITIKGYNGSTEHLEIKIDTLKFEHDILPSNLFETTKGYTFLQGKDKVTLTITEKNTGKAVLKKELKKENGPAEISFLYIQGKVSDMPSKMPVEEGKLKISYMFMPTITNYNQRVDIVLGKYYLTPKVFEEIATIKNVKPYTFSEPITIPTFSTVNQEYNGVRTAVMVRPRIYKAGTKEFYTQNTGYTWHVTSSAVPVPATSTASSKYLIFNESAAGNSIRFNKISEF